MKNKKNYRVLVHGDSVAGGMWADTYLGKNLNFSQIRGLLFEVFVLLVGLTRIRFSKTTKEILFYTVNLIYFFLRKMHYH